MRLPELDVDGDEVEHDALAVVQCRVRSGAARGTYDGGDEHVHRGT